MAKLTRVTQKIFGENSGFHEMAQIGSLAASSPVYTTDPTTIQALSNFVDGLYAILVGENSPAAQDFNALFFLITRQLEYLFQEGAAEWDSGTTYYIGSLVNDDAGNLYVSLTDDNLNNALTSATNWTLFNGLSTNAYPSDLTVLSGTTRQYNVPTFASGKTWTVDSGGTLVTIGNVTMTGASLILNGDWIAL